MGARFHGMEEVVSSNLTRSTKTFHRVTVPPPARTWLPESNWSPNPKLNHGRPWASCGFRCCPHLGLQRQRDRRNGQLGHRLSCSMSAGDDSKRFPYKDVAHEARGHGITAGGSRLAECILILGGRVCPRDGPDCRLPQPDFRPLSTGAHLRVARLRVNLTAEAWFRMASTMVATAQRPHQRAGDTSSRERGR